jgi:biotin carboxylase
MKKIMFLGGGAMQTPPIKYAFEKGYYIITVDYLPDNPGHKYASEYCNISIIDKEAVLKKAKELNIDGIVAYASDLAANTAAYVAEAMGLPSNSYDSVNILTHKGRFRTFLKENGFNCPKASSFSNREEARAFAVQLSGDVFIKPVDSSGSKGITCLERMDDFDDSFNHAIKYSICKEVLVEESIRTKGYQIAGDGFVIDGELKFRCWANEHFDKLCNGLVPIGESFPVAEDIELLEVAKKETQRLLTLLRINGGAFNFDFIFNDKGDFYFLELGPRNGGNLIPEVIKYATGVDTIKYTVEWAVGNDCSGLAQEPCKGFWASYILHSYEDGVFKKLLIDEFIESRIIEKNVAVYPGQKIEKFIGADQGFGSMILKFSSEEEMLFSMDNMEKHIKFEYEQPVVTLINKA